MSFSAPGKMPAVMLCLMLLWNFLSFEECSQYEEAVSVL